MQKNVEISIIIPAYNCQKYVPEVLKRTTFILTSLRKSHEVVVVCDGCTDDTQKVAEKEAKKYGGKVKVFGYKKNKGKGFAVRYGMSNSSGKVVGFLDCDLEIDAGSIKTLYQKLVSENRDCVVGSKRHISSKVYYPFIRKVVSAVYYLFVKTLFNFSVSDTQAGIKLFRKSAVKKIYPKLSINGFSFDIEMLYWLSKFGYSIADAPITVHPERAAETSVMHSFGIIKASIEMFTDTLLFYISTKKS